LELNNDMKSSPSPPQLLRHVDPDHFDEADVQLLEQAANKLVRFAQLAGVAPEQMISLLDSGISIRELLVFLVSRRSEPDNDRVD
jgi:hypothetical protein